MTRLDQLDARQEKIEQELRDVKAERAKIKRRQKAQETRERNRGVMMLANTEMWPGTGETVYAHLAAIYEKGLAGYEAEYRQEAPQGTAI